MSLTPRRLIACLFALIALAAVALAGLRYEQHYRGQLAAVRETLTVERAAFDVLSLLKDAETGQRGYVLTGQPAFLSPYDHALGALPARLAHLSALVADSQQQAARAARLSALCQQKLHELAQTVALRREQKSDEALAIITAGEGRRVMDDARATISAMLKHERTILAQRQKSVEHALHSLFMGLVGSWAVLFCALSYGMWSAARAADTAKDSTERIQESERAMRVLAENASDLVRIIDREARLIYVSPSCHRLLGFTREEMLGMQPRALLHDDEREVTRTLAQRVQNGEADDLPYVHRLRNKSGTYRWFETTFQRVREGDTATDHIHLSSRDITERREAEDGLRDQTERLRSILASMGDGVIVLGADRRLLVINAPAQRFISIPQGELLPVDWAERFAFDLDGVTPFPLSNAPLTRALAGEAVEDVEMVMRRDDGELCTLSFNTRPLHDGDAIVGCVAVLHDVSERRAFEQELHESEERLNVLANASFDGVAISRDRHMIDVNQTLANWVGQSREALIGTDGLALFAGEDQAEVTVKSAQGGVYETRLLRGDGTLRPIEVRGSFANYRGESVRIAVIRDISDRLRREAELKDHAEVMRTLSLRDELTGLYNRRGFTEVAGQALRTLARSKLNGCLFFADLDGLKAVNDSLGHEMGDRVIAAAGKLLAGVFRDSDIVARLGGDEFAILAIECGLADIPSVLERIENRVAESNRREPLYAMSLSVGTALFEPPATADLEGLMDQADQAMYDQKRLSRQRRMA